MNKKLLFIIGFAIAVMFTFLVPFCFGTDGDNVMNDAVNGVRNTVGGAENAIENAVHDVTTGTNSNMNYSANMSSEDIAKTLDIPLGTVKTRIRKAKKMLKERLEAIGYDR